jgi:hypothetical protein
MSKPRFPTARDAELLATMPLTPVMISGVDMLCLLGAMQLVLRHPGFKGRSRDVAETFAQELEKRIVEASPGMEGICAAGWDPEQDV